MAPTDERVIRIRGEFEDVACFDILEWLTCSLLRFRDMDLVARVAVREFVVALGHTPCRGDLGERIEAEIGGE